jgi:hypothetical protein
LLLLEIERLHGLEEAILRKEQRRHTVCSFSTQSFHPSQCGSYGSYLSISIHLLRSRRTIVIIDQSRQHGIRILLLEEKLVNRELCSFVLVFVIFSILILNLIIHIDNKQSLLIKHFSRHNNKSSRISCKIQSSISFLTLTWGYFIQSSVDLENISQGVMHWK